MGTRVREAENWKGGKETLILARNLAHELMARAEKMLWGANVWIISIRC